MLEMEKQHLVALMNLTVKIENNDGTVMNDVAILNSNVPNEDSKYSLMDIMISETEKVTETNKDLLKQVINSFDFLEKDFYLSLIDLKVAAGKPEVLKATILDMLDRTFNIPTSALEYRLYNRIVTLAIVLKDREVIEKAINKLQSL